MTEPRTSIEADGDEEVGRRSVASRPAGERWASTGVRLLDRFSLLINAITIFVTSLVLCFIFFIVGSGVLARYVVHSSLPWTEEAGSFLFIWLTFLGAAITYRERGHPTVMVLVLRFPKALQRIVLVVAHVIVILVALVFVYYGLGFSSLLGGESATSLPIRMSAIYTAVPVGGVLLIIHALAAIGRDIESPQVEQVIEAGE